MKALVRNPGEEQVVPCPCGESHRFFTAQDGGKLGFHVTSICGAETHFHRRMTEVYYVLEGSGQIELDDEVVNVKQGIVILIPPEVKHRGLGNFKVIVVYDHPELHQEDTFH